MYYCETLYLGVLIGAYSPEFYSIVQFVLEHNFRELSLKKIYINI